MEKGGKGERATKGRLGDFEEVLLRIGKGFKVGTSELREKRHSTEVRKTTEEGENGRKEGQKGGTRPDFDRNMNSIAKVGERHRSIA